MNKALYRTHRPKLLKDILGQESIVSILQNAAIQDKLAHAYLFYGPRGTGKTSMARLISKIACCETREKDKEFKKKGEPCNKCQACTEIDAGRGIDVVEIDAASNRGIDEIRNLKQGIRLSPSSYSHKVFIIDETHMLTKEAFNALLKTLEEPPAHAILILATTEYEKVPPTITSRTQKFHFKKISIDNVINKLKLIAKAEKIKIEDEALELIASLAGGSFRDGESLLQQIASLKENVTLADVEKNLGEIGFDKTAEFAELILKNDLKGSLSYINNITESGFNVVDLNRELIHYLRRLLTLKFNPDLEDEMKKELTSKELSQIKENIKLLQEDKHIKLIKSLISAYSQMRYSPFAAIPLEIALIENLKN